MVLSKKYDIHISYFYIMHSPHFSLCSHPHMTSSRPIYPPPASIVTMAKGMRIFRVSAPHVDKKIQVSCYLFSFPYIMYSPHFGPCPHLPTTSSSSTNTSPASLVTVAKGTVSFRIGFYCLGIIFITHILFRFRDLIILRHTQGYG